MKSLALLYELPPFLFHPPLKDAGIAPWLSAFYNQFGEWDRYWASSGAGDTELLSQVGLARVLVLGCGYGFFVLGW